MRLSASVPLLLLGFSVGVRAAEPAEPTAPLASAAPEIGLVGQAPQLLDPAALVSFRALTTLDTAGLSFAPCAATAPRPAEPGSGTVVFELQLRRGRVSLVSVMSADPTALPYQECLTRVLADSTWPVRRGTLRLPVQVERPARPEVTGPSDDR